MAENRNTIIKKANEFRIWRAAESVKWDCTQKELADETGLSRNTVQRACKRNNWAPRLRVDPADNLKDRPEVDAVMAYAGYYE